MIIAIEGLSGAGKTTLIKRINESLDYSYVREAREFPTAYVPPNEVDLYFLYKHLEVLKKLQKSGGFFILDRTFISTLAVIYAKINKNLLLSSVMEKAISIINQSRLAPLDILIICNVDTEIAIKRRNLRDSYKHPLWSNKPLVSLVADYYYKLPLLYHKELIKVDTSSFNYSPPIEEIVRRLHENIRD